MQRRGQPPPVQPPVLQLPLVVLQLPAGGATASASAGTAISATASSHWSGSFRSRRWRHNWCRGCRNSSRCDIIQYSLSRRFSLCTKIDTRSALLTCNAVNGGLGDKIAIQRNGTGGVVIARNRMINRVGIGVGIEHGADRNFQLAGFLNRNRFLVGVDHENQIWCAAHILDAAKRPLQLVAFAGQAEQFFLGVL